MIDDLAKLSPGFGELARAAVANREERFDEAEAHYKQAVELMPEDSTPAVPPNVLYNTGPSGLANVACTAVR